MKTRFEAIANTRFSMMGTLRFAHPTFFSTV